MRRLLFSVAVCTLILANFALAQQSPLGQSLKDIEVAEHWIYDDLPKAWAEAERTGKPLLVVLRCVPCPPGKTLDEAVMRPTGDLAKLEEEFVCVRVIQTNGLDLDLFQFDYDMSWSALFLNADRTIYGRYGTRQSSGAGSDGNLSAAAFTKAAERALALHRDYPANKDALAGKTGKPARWKVPEAIPGLVDHGNRATERKTCIHCHMVKDYALRAKWQEGDLRAADLYVFPAPQQVGLVLDQDDGLNVVRVLAESPAAAAGLKQGDAIVAADGQPLVSTADLTWVLHNAANDATLPVKIRRGEQTVDADLKLAGDWKRSDIAWRASSWFGLRQGLKVDPVPREARTARGLDDAGGALEVKGMFGKGAAPLQAAGLRKGDVIVKVDGRPAPQTESEFLVELRTQYGPKESVTFTVVRGTERKDVSVPLW